MSGVARLRLDPDRLTEGLAHLAGLDADFARVLDSFGAPPLHQREGGFSSLLRSIVAQQLSIHAAASIWRKLEAVVDPLTPETFLAAGPERLRQAGLSVRKVQYGRELAAAIAEGRLDLAALHDMEDEAAIAALVQAKGIGRWTAEIYLMFALGRPDILPVNDVGLIVAAQALKGLAVRPTPAEMAEMALAWRPWRSVASLLLWHLRHNMPDWN